MVIAKKRRSVEQNENSESYLKTIKNIEDTKLFYNERVAEISEFFSYLEIFYDRRTELTCDGKKQDIDSDFLSILHSNGILLLYNLIESIFHLLLKNIFADISIKRHHFNELNSTFKEAIFKNLKHTSPSNSVEKLADISFDIVELGFNPKKEFSGNLDIKKIKEIGKKYGIELRFKILEAGHESDGDFKEDIKMIKNSRNDLGHGNLTFIECGNKISFEKLKQYRISVETSLGSLLEEIDDYISQKRYLKKNG